MEKPRLTSALMAEIKAHRIKGVIIVLPATKWTVGHWQIIFVGRSATK
jgi:hypothetical protein